MLKILGIETSCDETAISIVTSNREILSNLVHSQIQEHEKFGGVVPEVAARSHIEILPRLFQQSLLEANLDASAIDAIAVTGGPGLIGGVMVGVIFAKAIASALNKPFLAINHLEGHALTARLTNNVEFPYLLLLASGGHCQLLLVEARARYTQLATTVDDAAGEAFDKVAKMLGLGWPGGAVVEKLARSGSAQAFDLPLPLCEPNEYNFSFSGLKTAVRNLIAKHASNLEAVTPDICASFQETVTKVFIYKIDQAIKKIGSATNQLVLAGGVAANSYIRNAIKKHILATHGYTLIAPPGHLCTDNAAMIAWVGAEKIMAGLSDSLDFVPRSRWPLV